MGISVRAVIRALCLAVPIGLLTPSAQASLYTTTFSGKVRQEQGSGLAVGGTVTGTFVYDSATGSFASYAVGGFALAQPVGGEDAKVRMVQTVPPLADYQAKITAIVPQDTVTTRFQLQLIPASPGGFGSSDPLAILSDPLLLGLRSSTSYFGFNSTGRFGFVQSFQTTVDTISTTVSTPTPVPEPSTMLLLGSLALGFGIARRR